jgi:menaquinone-specific isochorismate synthase
MTALAPATDLLGALPATGGTAWVRGGKGFVGWGEAARFDPGTGPGRFARAAAALPDLLGASGVAFASFTFDADAPGSVVLVPAGLVTHRDPPLVGTQPVQLLPSRRVTYAGSSIPELDWLEAVDAVVREIGGASGLEKVVLARDLFVRAPDALDVRLLTARLAARFPSCWTFLVDGLLGATPELLVRRAGREVTSLVLAGSARRGSDPAEDAKIGEALRASSKDAGEHRLSVASVRTALSPLCTRLDVSPEPSLLRLDNVQHLATQVHGTLAAPLTALEVAGALHPTAAVGGTPTALALDRIRALEGMDRSRYSGPVGWVDARGDGEFGIALRCAELTPAGARLFAGAGIVAGSRPEAELEETRLKLRAMQSALEEG